MEKKNYQFTQVPTNLFILLDNNCRSMLFTLIQLSSYYADEDGWFFRRWEDLIVESNLSLNLSMATVQTLFNHHIIEAKPTGYGKGRKPNYYKVNFDNFAKYDELSIEDAMKNPDLKIHTVDYKGSNFKLNLVRETVNKTVTKVVKSENNIDNIENADNVKNVYNIKNEKKQFEIECKNENIEVNKDIYTEFQQHCDDMLLECKTEKDLISTRALLSSRLRKKTFEIPRNVMNRCSSYLDTKFNELSQTVMAEASTDEDFSFLG